MVKVYLSGKNSDKFCLVDDADYPLVSGYKWYLTKKGYANCNFYKDGKRTAVKMHVLIMGFPNGQIDHRNRDKSDNTRENLRVVDHTKNQQNKGFRVGKDLPKGVTPNYGKKFRARINVNNKTIYLGNFDSIEEASKAYDIAAVQYFGEFAATNKDLVNE